MLDEAFQKVIFGRLLLDESGAVAQRLAPEFERLNRLQQRHDKIVKRLDSNSVESRGIINRHLNQGYIFIETYYGKTQATKYYENLEKENETIIRDVAPVEERIRRILLDPNLGQDIQTDIANLEHQKLTKENEKKKAEEQENNTAAIRILTKELEKIELGIDLLKKLKMKKKSLN